ncbi:hypothetical protein vseg_000311 [Gypsophila vaccaria]
MGLVVQVIWQLLNLCMLAFVIGSSGFGEPLSVESFSLTPLTEAQVRHSKFEPDSVVFQPSVASPSSKLQPLHQNGNAPPPFQPSRQLATPPLVPGSATSAPTQTAHDSSPPLSSSVQPHDGSLYPVAKPPNDSAPLVAETPHYSTSPPVAESAHSPSATISPVDVTPPPVVEPPQVLNPEPPVETPPLLPTSPPYESPQKAPIVQLPPVSLPVLSPPSQMGPSQVSLPTVVPSTAFVPPPSVLPFPLEPQQPSSSPLTAAKPPPVLTPKAPVEAPPLLPTSPPYESPQKAPTVQLPPAPLPVLSPPSQMGPSQASAPTALVPSNASVLPPLLPFPLEPQQPSSSPLPAAKPPPVLAPKASVEAPPLLPTSPPYKSPRPAPIVQLPPVPLPILSPPSQMGPPQASSPTASAFSNASAPSPLVLPFPLEPQPPPSSSSASPANEPSQPTVYGPPPPAGDTPHLISSPPFVVSPSYAPPLLPSAEPPHASSLPLAANPPDAPPLLPVAEPPEALTFVPPPESQPAFPSLPPASAIMSPPTPLNESSPPPQSPPSTPSSPPESIPPIALAPLPQLIPPITSSPPPPKELLNASSPVPPLTPPITSSPPPPKELLNASSPVPPLIPPITSSPPPPKELLNASSPVPPLIPHTSPPSSALPPSSSFSPPLTVPPPVDTPPNLPTPPPSVPQNASSLPPQMGPPYVSSPPPQSPPLNASSPVSPLTPPLSPPIPSSPPSSSMSPPLMVPPPMMSAPGLPASPPPVPQNESSLPPQMGPPHSSSSSPPPQLVVPPLASPPTPALQNASSSPPQMGPPHASSPPPQLVVPPPASPPTSVLPSTPLVSPPTVLPSPVPPSLSPAVQPHESTVLSPPMPSQTVSPLPHLIPPHSFSPPLAEPPQVRSAPPPSKLPVISPPSSSKGPEAIPPRASSPPHFLSPPIASPPQENGSHASASPPMMVPVHMLFAPPPSEPSYPFAPPPAVNSSVHGLPPHSSQRKVTKRGAPPPLSTSPETSPPSGTLSRASPPFEQVKPDSPPRTEQSAEAPKHSTPPSRFNASAPHALPLPARAPSTKSDDDTASPPAPRDRVPEHLSPETMSPRHAPKFDLQNETAPAPLSFQVNPAANESHHYRHHSPGPLIPVAPVPSPHKIHEISSATSPSPHAPPDDSEIPFLPPEVSPSGSSPKNTKKPLSSPLRSLPPPPPNADCAYLTCPEPSTNTPPGAPCGCVWPMQVGMRLSVALYTFFPLVSELAKEIASGVFLKPGQVRVMGANAAIQEPEKTIVLVDLVPLDDKFDNITSFLMFDRFWHKQVVINKSLFGDYDILYVRYPGLPPPPPMAPDDAAVINSMPYSVGDPNGSQLHPLGVDVTKQRHKHRPNAIIIAVIILSAVLGVLMCSSLAWLLVFRHTNSRDQPTLTPRAVASLARSSGPTGHSTGSGQSSPLSLGSSLATYTGSAKTFSGSEIEKATDNFNPSRILGEGGFGLVYSGVLDDDTKIAVKVLKRDDQQGGREFLAEVEMLSRLHHRNLVKLIGICTDERMRCLVYELIPNGSVDSHLHGTDKDIAPLDWASRLKIALGAARGLAYLHEDSSPRVIHRDFKSSNILLENDFTPKVSDFGLARTALDEENKHISTRVMGTFGYVAPEYAMTGHLLVKSDVYSYGVVLLELLTGRKPVDMSQPAGQENLVAWTRPLLTSKEGLESIIDTSLGSEVPFESVAKVAAIASMCVQPEVSHRPFMGEVVQALKLVCNECDDSKDGNSRSHSRENLSVDFDAKPSSPVSRPLDPSLQGEFSMPNYTPRYDVEKGLSVSEIFSASAALGRQTSDSFRRHSASGPLRTPRGRQFWQRMRRQSRGSVSEHGLMYRLWAGSH